MGVPQQKVIHTTTYNTKKAPMVNRNIMVQEISHNVMRALALIMFGAVIGGSTLFAGWTLCLCLNTESTTGWHRQLLPEATRLSNQLARFELHAISATKLAWDSLANTNTS